MQVKCLCYGEKSDLKCNQWLVAEQLNCTWNQSDNCQKSLIVGSRTLQVYLKHSGSNLHECTIWKLVYLLTLSDRAKSTWTDLVPPAFILVPPFYWGGGNTISIIYAHYMFLHAINDPSGSKPSLYASTSWFSKMIQKDEKSTHNFTGELISKYYQWK